MGLDSKQLHIAMFPWFAFGHMNPFLYLSNELAKRGHKISFLLPKKASIQLQPSNLHPSLITFYPITVPHVEGLPLGTEMCSEVPIGLGSHIATAMDLTRPQVDKLLSELKPNLVFFDFAHWVPELAKELGGIKTVCYSIVSAASLAIALVPGCKKSKNGPLTVADLQELPLGYPSKTVVLREHEARSLPFTFITMEYGKGTTFYERTTTGMSNCDAIAIRTCQEIEGQLIEYIAAQYQKPIYLTGPILPEPAALSPLEKDQKWIQWLDQFEPGSVLFCAFGSEWILEKDQFQELVLGFELTKLPFLIALKPPIGSNTIEEALPEGFEEKVKGRGVVYGGWVPQIHILRHKSIGCFVSHCGFSSMWESLMSNSQIALVPNLGDQILNSRLLADELKVGVEVEKDENGRFSKGSLCKAIKSLMDEDSEFGAKVKENHNKWRETLVSQGFMSNYMDRFVHKLCEEL